MPYEALPGTIPHRAVEHLKTLDEGSELSTVDFAAALEVEPHAFVQCMGAPRKHRVVNVRRSDSRGRALLWSLGTGQPVATLDDEVDESEDTPFNAALWADGELVIYGATENTDGSVTLSPDQVTKVKRLIAWSAAA
jgi:hypothetical protein